MKGLFLDLQPFPRFSLFSTLVAHGPYAWATKFMVFPQNYKHNFPVITWCAYFKDYLKQSAYFWIFLMDVCNPFLRVLPLIFLSSLMIISLFHLKYQCVHYKQSWKINYVHHYESHRHHLKKCCAKTALGNSHLSNANEKK